MWTYCTMSPKAVAVRWASRHAVGSCFLAFVLWPRWTALFPFSAVIGCGRTTEQCGED
jgi:hypothetical protein